MKFFDMFSGIGGFHLGITQAHPDWECAGFSEIDKHAINIYQKHFKDVKNYGNATNIVPEELPDFDLLCGGFPCVAFSIAGKRKAFDDPRGRLFFEIERIAKKKKPRMLLFENVAGLLSAGIALGTGFFEATKGKSKGEITQDRGRIKDEPERGWQEITLNICPGFVLNEILLSVSELGDGFTEWEVLNSKNFGVPQNRERIFIVGHSGKGCSRAVFPIGQDGKEADGKKHPKGVEQTAQTLTARDYENWNGNFVAGTLTGGGHSGGLHSDMTAICVQRNQQGKVFQKPICGTIHEDMGNNQAPKIAIPVLTPDRPTKRQNGRRFKENGEPSFTLTGQDIHGVMVSSVKIDHLSRKNPQRQGKIDSQDYSHTLRSIGPNGVFQNQRIRRLTPSECEALQAFPRGWTEYGADGKKISNSQRYKCLGNAVTVNVVKTIAERLG